MKNMLQISSFIMLIVGIWIIYDIVVPPTMYPEAKFIFTRSAILKYKENNKVNEDEYVNIVKNLESTKKSYLGEYHDNRIKRLIGALCLFSSSLIMYKVSKKFNNSIEQKDFAERKEVGGKS